jgi:hypothetical protein
MINLIRIGVGALDTSNHRVGWYLGVPKACALVYRLKWVALYTAPCPSVSTKARMAKLCSRLEMAIPTRDPTN